MEIEGLEFYASPIILKSSNIDLILGMDWLKAHTASIVCATKTVHLLHPSDEIVADMKILRDLLNEYGKIGSNLNQIARYFNTGGERSLAMEDEIRHCISQLFELRKVVLKLAGESDGNP